jgi:hypothetical protein
MVVLSLGYTPIPPTLRVPEVLNPARHPSWAGFALGCPVPLGTQPSGTGRRERGFLARNTRRRTPMPSANGLVGRG